MNIMKNKKIIIFLLIFIFLPTVALAVDTNLFSATTNLKWQAGEIRDNGYYFLTDSGLKLKFDPTGQSGDGCDQSPTGEDVPSYYLIENSGTSKNNWRETFSYIQWQAEEESRASCDTAYFYIPTTLEPGETSTVEVSGDIYSSGDVVGKDPETGKTYLAILGERTVVSGGEITDLEGSLTRMAGYTVNENSTSAYRQGILGFEKITRNMEKEYAREKGKKLLFADLKGQTDFTDNPDGDIYVYTNPDSNDHDLVIDEALEIPGDSKKIVIVNGNLQVNKNVKTDESSLLVFIVFGDIIIDGDEESGDDVNQLEAGLISLKSNPDRDFENPQPADWIGEIRVEHSNPNLKMLSIRGFLIASKLVFNREPDPNREPPIYIGTRVFYDDQLIKRQIPGLSYLINPTIDTVSP